MAFSFSDNLLFQNLLNVTVLGEIFLNLSLDFSTIAPRVNKKLLIEQGGVFDLYLTLNRKGGCPRLPSDLNYSRRDALS